MNEMIEEEYLQKVEALTFWSVLRRKGLRAAVNFKAERACIKEFRRMHDEARQHGYNLYLPDYKPPWWFKWASKIEWWTRPQL